MADPDKGRKDAAEKAANEKYAADVAKYESILLEIYQLEDEIKQAETEPASDTQESGVGSPQPINTVAELKLVLLDKYRELRTAYVNAGQSIPLNVDEAIARLEAKPSGGRRRRKTRRRKTRRHRRKHRKTLRRK